MRILEVDTHTHTISSGHTYSTLLENCEEARRKGLKAIAMTDHGPKIPGGPHIFHFGNLRVIPDAIYGVEVFKGVELNIIDYNGTVDLNEDFLKRLDIVIASLHDVCITPSSIMDNTKAIIGAMKNKYVDIIAHPGNPMYPIDVDEVLKAAKEYNVLIEINNSSFNIVRPGSYDNCKTIAEKAVKNGNFMVTGSDAHICFDIGNFSKVNKLFDDACVPDELILTRDLKRLKDYLIKKGKLKNRLI